MHPTPKLNPEFNGNQTNYDSCLSLTISGFIVKIEPGNLFYVFIKKHNSRLNEVCVERKQRFIISFFEPITALFVFFFSFGSRNKDRCLYFFSFERKSFYLNRSRYSGFGHSCLLSVQTEWKPSTKKNIQRWNWNEGKPIDMHSWNPHCYLLRLRTYAPAMWTITAHIT